MKKVLVIISILALSITVSAAKDLGLNADQIKILREAKNTDKAALKEELVNLAINKESAEYAKTLTSAENKQVEDAVESYLRETKPQLIASEKANVALNKEVEKIAKTVTKAEKDKLRAEITKQNADFFKGASATEIDDFLKNNVAATKFREKVSKDYDVDKVINQYIK